MPSPSMSRLKVVNGAAANSDAPNVRGVDVFGALETNNWTQPDHLIFILSLPSDCDSIFIPLSKDQNLIIVLQRRGKLQIDPKDTIIFGVDVQRVRSASHNFRDISGLSLKAASKVWHR